MKLESLAEYKKDDKLYFYPNIFDEAKLAKITVFTDANSAPEQPKLINFPESPHKRTFMIDSRLTDVLTTQEIQALALANTYKPIKEITTLGCAVAGSALGGYYAMPAVVFAKAASDQSRRLLLTSAVTAFSAATLGGGALGYGVGKAVDYYRFGSGDYPSLMQDPKFQEYVQAAQAKVDDVITKSKQFKIAK